MTQSYKTYGNDSSIFTDKDWVRSIFEIDRETLSGAPLNVRTWSSADLKFTDTAIGGSLVINPLPQPCVLSDPVSSTHFLKKMNANDAGLSPYYSEAFDDNYRSVTFRFGNLAFTSLFGFLLNMYHPGAGSVANKGLIHKVLFTIGRVIGAAVSLITWPFTLFFFVLKGLNFFMRKPSSRYAYLKPNMPVYWSSVQTIVNHFLIDLGLIYRKSDILKDNGGGDDLSPNENQMEFMRSMWPNIYGANGFVKDGIMKIFDMQGQVDVFAVATRAQRLAIARQEALENINEFGGANIDVMAITKRAYKEKRGHVGMTISQYLSSWVTDGQSLYSAERPSSSGSGTDMSVGDSPKEENIDNQGLRKFLLAEYLDGGGFISFRVDDTGAVSETFSNSFQTSALMEKINSTSASARSTMFDLAGGSLGDNPFMDGLEFIVGGLKSMVEGAITTMGMGGILIAGGGGTVSMPKYWTASEAQLPKPGYQFTLKARYANNMCRFHDIYFPLACILAAALPQSVGKHSHSNPLYFEFYDKGRMQSRLAAIDSLTITRGDGNMGFTPDGHLMSVTVSFSITPMEEIIAMPFSESFSPTDTFISMVGGALVAGVPGALAGGFKDALESLTRGLFDDDTPWMDYMATLAGLGVNEQHYQWSKLKRRLAFNSAQYASKFSSAKFAAVMADSMPGKIAAALAIGTDHNSAFWVGERAEQ